MLKNLHDALVVEAKYFSSNKWEFIGITQILQVLFDNFAEGFINFWDFRN